MNFAPNTFGVEVTIVELLRLRGLAESLGLSSHRIVTQNMIGAHASAIRGRGVEFDEVRLYQPGDDIQRIDWRVTSRTGTPHTKLFKEERQRPVQLVIDQRSSMFFGSQIAFKSVVAARLGALCAWGALAHQDRVGGVIIGETHSQFFKALSGKRGVLRIVQALTAFSQRLTTNNQSSSSQLRLNAILKELVVAVHPGSLIILASDFYDYNQKTLHYLSLLRRHCDLLCFKIHDPIEKKLPPADLYGVSDGTRELVIDTRFASLRKKFEDDFQVQARKIYQECAQIGVPLIEIATDDDLGRKLAGVFGGKASKMRRRA